MVQAHNTVDLALDFDTVQPTAEERQTYDEVAPVLAKSGVILEGLQNFKGCEEFIRRAIAQPSPEAEEQAWNAVVPAVERLKTFYDYSLELQEVIPKLLRSLCRTANARQCIETQQALVKQFADVFNFSLRFDELKMVNPAIQNDFSYYRRSLNRMKLAKKTGELTIRDELANRMSLFFAYPTPMMNTINETTVKLFHSDTTIVKANVEAGLEMMANICQYTIESRRNSGRPLPDASALFALRGMTGSIILYDHLHPQGAFHRKSPINIKGCISVLRAHSSTEGLLNALRFTTIHLNDAETPNAIKQLLL
eukprot:TRINITY_DN314_c1_g2_i1.p1 TRINITY_DN314_c1_g2~~TRINITY_DN314_c1_g2_i1.p1  ORF type:complete len:310 (-),score=129.79 TRINITY_DN314_c1_g2_i1:97-1026(-)